MKVKAIEILGQKIKSKGKMTVFFMDFSGGTWDKLVMERTNDVNRIVGLVYGDRFGYTESDIPNIRMGDKIKVTDVGNSKVIDVENDLGRIEDDVVIVTNVTNEVQADKICRKIGHPAFFDF